MEEITQNDFFRFGFSVTAVVFGFDGEHIKVLLVERAKMPHKGEYALPSTLITLEDEVDASADKMLVELLGKPIYRRQLRSFFDPERHPMGRVVTIPYYGMTDISEPTPILPTEYATHAVWQSLDGLPELAFDHRNILDAARRRLKVRIPFQLMGHHFLPKQFTMNQLLKLHETLLETELDKRNFSKKIISMDLLKDTGINVNNITGRPARLYEFNQNYQEPTEI